MNHALIELRRFECGHEAMTAKTAPIRALCPECDAAMRWLTPQADEAQRAETWRKIHREPIRVAQESK